MSCYRTRFTLILLFCTVLLASCSSQTEINNNGNGSNNGGNGGSSGQFLFAGTAHAIFRSTDSGATWSGMNAGPVQSVFGFAIYGNTIFAATFGGILASNDNGMTWALVGDSIGAFSIYRFGNYLIAGTDYGMRRSADGGKTWQGLSYASGVSAFASRGNEIIGACFYTGGGDLYKSTDSGASWNQYTNGINAEDLDAVACDSLFYYAGSHREGAFRSSDRGQNWSTIDINTPYVYAMLSNNGAVYAATDRAVMRTTDDGIVWQELGFPSAYSESSLLFNGQYLFCGTSGAGVFSSTDRGTTWKQVRTGLTDTVILSLGMK